MRFTISHDLDAPLDAIELAVLSPELGPRLGHKVASLESVITIEHTLRDGELHRVLRFQANAPLALLNVGRSAAFAFPFKGYDIGKDVMSWEEQVTYRLADHASTWTVSPQEQWSRYLRSSGTYQLERLPDGRTRRRVEGELDIRLPLFGALVERLALTEVQRTYDAEADTLLELVSS